MKKIKCLHIISNMSAGGAQKIILNYINDLHNDKDIELSLLILSPKTNHENEVLLDKYNIKTTYLDSNGISATHNYIKKIYNFKRLNKKIIKYLIENKPDIVHVHLFGTLLLAYKAIVKCNIPIRFYTLHSNPSRFRGIRLNVLRKSFNKYGFNPICVTKEQAIFAKDYYRFSNYEVIHNGVDFDRIRKQILKKEDARKALNLNNDDFIICAVGRLDPIKRYDFLIKIFNNILKSKKNSKLVIAGSGNELNNLKKLVSDLNVENDVIFLGNISNPIKLYCASNVLAITSKSESASLVLLEAQACNLRCVISDGVPSESIITNRVKKMLATSTIEDWTEALLDSNYVCEKKYDFCDYEVHKMSEKLKNIYIKYWKEYVNEK